MKKEQQTLLLGFLLTVLIVGVVGVGLYLWQPWKTGATPSGGATGGTEPTGTATGGVVYTDLGGNLMDKAKFATTPTNAYSGIPNQSVKFYDITKNPQNDPRTNVLAVPDFQIVSMGSSPVGYLNATKKAVAGHTFVYLFSNTSNAYYDVTGTFTVPANINAFAPAFDIGNILAPAVGTLATKNESGIVTTNGIHRNLTNGTLSGATLSTDYMVYIGSNTYAEFLRVWGEFSSTTFKNAIVGISVIQKAGPTTGVSVDTSDVKNPIISVQELTAQYPLTFTYYIQGDTTVQTGGSYTLYVDDWNAVPGKFADKKSAIITHAQCPNLTAC